MSPDIYRVSIKRNQLRCIRHLIRTPHASCIGVLDEAFWACLTNGRPGQDREIMCDDWPGNQMVEVLEEAAGESEVWACSTTL